MCVFAYVCVDVCLHVCLHVCLYVCVCVHALWGGGGYAKRGGVHD